MRFIVLIPIEILAILAMLIVFGVTFGIPGIVIPVIILALMATTFR
jgi:hypothetical protein